MIDKRQKEEGWGAGVIPRLARDLRDELPEVKGYSERNLKRMIRFYREYPHLCPEVPQPVAQLPGQARDEKVPRLVAQFQNAAEEQEENIREYILNLPWSQNFLLIEKFKDLSVRRWYMQQALENEKIGTVMIICISLMLSKHRNTYNHDRPYNSSYQP